MSSSSIDKLLAFIDTPRDGALLRFSLGNEYLKANDPARALEHLRAAIGRDPQYSAAWKLLGRALEATGDRDAALAAYRDGIAAAESRGDRQAVREMAVFERRLSKQT